MRTTLHLRRVRSCVVCEWCARGVVRVRVRGWLVGWLVGVMMRRRDEVLRGRGGLLGRVTDRVLLACRVFATRGVC